MCQRMILEILSQVIYIIQLSQQGLQTRHFWWLITWDVHERLCDLELSDRGWQCLLRYLESQDHSPPPPPSSCHHFWPWLYGTPDDDRASAVKQSRDGCCKGVTDWQESLGLKSVSEWECATISQYVESVQPSHRYMRSDHWYRVTLDSDRLQPGEITEGSCW